jgi:3-hydroxyisobutyrate dehydrogenase
MKVGFIGLGTMGFHMAGHLAAAGFTTVVYNRTPSRAKQWTVQHQGDDIASIAELAQQCDVVMTCVGNDDDVRGVYFGDSGILSNVPHGAILVDHTTTSAVLAKEIGAKAKQAGVSFLDAPVSGGEVGAVNGQLATMVGGSADALGKVMQMLNAYSKSVTHMGVAGNGQLCKMANQICIAGVLQGLSEALTFAEVSGLDIDQVSDAISGGAAGSWQLSNRLKTMHAREFDFGFAVDWMRKDLAFCLDEAKQHQIELKCTEHVDSVYSKLQQQGESRSDTSVLVKQFD